MIDKDLLASRDRVVLDKGLLAKISSELDKRQGDDTTAVYEVRTANNMTPAEFYPYHMAWLDSFVPVEETNQAGVAVTALFHDMLVASPLFTGSYKDAEALSEMFDVNIVNANWLTTLNGTTFDRGFDPKEM